MGLQAAAGRGWGTHTCTGAHATSWVSISRQLAKLALSTKDHSCKEHAEQEGLPLVRAYCQKCHRTFWSHLLRNLACVAACGRCAQPPAGYYKVLGLDVTADPAPDGSAPKPLDTEAIKAAFKAQAMQLHPDRFITADEGERQQVRGVAAGCSCVPLWRPMNCRLAFLAAAAHVLTQSVAATHGSAVCVQSMGAAADQAERAMMQLRRHMSSFRSCRWHMMC